MKSTAGGLSVQSIHSLRRTVIHPELPLRLKSCRATPRYCLCTASSAISRPSIPIPRSSKSRTPFSRSYSSSPVASNRPATSKHVATTHLQSSFYPSAVAVAVLATAGFVYAYLSNTTSPDSQEQPEDLIDEMAYEVPPGRPGNLTPEQEQKLRKLWIAVFQTLGVKEDVGAAHPAVEVEKPAAAAPAEPETPKKKHFGLFGGGKKEEPKKAEDDKYGETAQYHETLANHSPEAIRKTMWEMVKHDHPDALVLRFLRARKWDVEKALVMLVSTMNWRMAEMHLDDDIMKNGEEGALLAEKGEGAAKTEAKGKQVGHDFLEQIRMGKSFLHGQDAQGRPICYVRVRLHKQGEQCEESLERYTVYLIETARMVLSPPVDTATILFDMTGFSMANMDYTPVKFMIKCFEANYPESLGTVLINNAPWVFQGIWKIIKGWLDPVVAAKVHFVNNKSDLSNFIPPSQLLKELGGEEDWTYTYVEPTLGENETMKDTATRDKLVAEREEDVKTFEKLTAAWIRDPKDESVRKQREELAGKLRAGYWKLDPYVRARSLYDRIGALKKDGSVDWYAKGADAAPAGKMGVETAADDVD